MKIKSIQLHPFAGITDRRIDLTDGLNLIFGPNEAGKSTMFHAIQHGLLTKTNLTSSQLNAQLGNYFPLGGGDVIRATIEIQINGDVFNLSKEWKKGTRNGASTLRKTDGVEITNEEEVQNWILDHLPVKAATMREIMLAKQSALHQTLKQVQKLSEVKQDIGAVLRKSVMETGGISVDKFRESINEKYKEYYDHWDREKKRPEKDAQGRDRGLDNKWAHPKGVLKSWYTKEEEKRKYHDIVAHENTVDELNQQLQEKSKVLKGKQGWIHTWESKLEELREKDVVEEKKKSAQKEYYELKQIADKWPVYSNELKAQQPKLEKLNHQIEQLDKEKEQATQKSSFEALQKRIRKLEELKNQIAEIEDQLKKVPKITHEDYEAVSSLRSGIEKLQTQIKASELSFNIEALEDTELRIVDADEKEETVSLTKGDTQSLTKNGVATIHTDKFKLQITPGKGNLNKVVHKLQQHKKELQNKLETFELSSADEAKPIHENYQRLVDKKGAKESQFQDLLEEDTFVELKMQLEKAPDLEKVRDLSEIQKERDSVFEKRSSLKTGFEQMQEKVTEWKEEYTDTNGVFRKVARTLSETEKYEEKLKEMPELPEQFDNVNDFLAEFKSVEASIDTGKEQIKAVELKIAELSDPELSAEEQKNIKEDTKNHFDKVLAQAESLHRVKEKTDQMLAKLENETYTPLVTGLIKWLSKMSGGRFEEVKLHPDGKEIPDKFVTNDNKEIPFHLLSHGTKDLTALAWRLTVIEQFLEGKQSCILLDDPLVDMDQSRKKSASKAIEEMARQQQVLVFSCHEDIREIIQASNTVEMQEHG